MSYFSSILHLEGKCKRENGKSCTSKKKSWFHGRICWQKLKKIWNGATIKITEWYDMFHLFEGKKGSGVMSLTRKLLLFLLGVMGCFWLAGCSLAGVGGSGKVIYANHNDDDAFAMQLKNTFIYTVEGWPSLEDIIPELKAKGIKSVTLMPMMMVAGDHANNDMAGDDPDSHKSVLMKAGFKVNTYIHGLGENKAIRSLFVERANESWDMLEAK